jgi:hypothetical protein
LRMCAVGLEPHRMVDDEVGEVREVQLDFARQRILRLADRVREYQPEPSIVTDRRDGVAVRADARVLDRLELRSRAQEELRLELTRTSRRLRRFGVGLGSVVHVPTIPYRTR